MLTRVLRTVPLDRIDQRSQVGVALRRIRQELTAHLGGKLTTTQRLLVDQVAVKALVVRAVGEWVLSQPTLVMDGKDGPRLLAVVEQHDGMQKTLVGMLKELGWTQPEKEVETLQSYVARRDAEKRH